MSRPLSERVKDWRFWGEQVGHLALGVSGLGIVEGYRAAAFDGWQIAAGVTTGALWVLVREVIDGWPIESVGDAIVDSAFKLLGGLGSGLIFWGMA